MSEAMEEVSRTIGDYTFSATLPVTICEGCQERFYHSNDLNQFHIQAVAWLAQAGANGGEIFRFMRKTLGLRIKELAQLLDETPENISHWEQMHSNIDRKAMSLMGAFVLDRLHGHNDTHRRLLALQQPATITQIELQLSSSRV